MILSGTFKLNNVSAEDYGIILTAPPVETFAKRDVETIAIPGRSGDLVLDNGRYSNVAMEYACAVIPPTGKTLREAVVEAVAFLRQLSSYARLEDTFHPDHYFMAMAVDAVSVESIMEKAGVFTMPLQRKPQKFLISGETAKSFSSSGSAITNPTKFPSKPLIRLSGSGSGTLTIGGKVVRIDAVTSYFYLDCEAMNAYRKSGSNAPENKNNVIYAPEFPELAPGSNTVSWTGGITSVQITPRWWTL